MKFSNLTAMVTILLFTTQDSANAILQAPTIQLNQIDENPFKNEGENIERRAAKEDVKKAMKEMMKTGNKAQEMSKWSTVKAEKEEEDKKKEEEDKKKKDEKEKEKKMQVGSVVDQAQTTSTPAQKI